MIKPIFKNNFFLSLLSILIGIFYTISGIGKILNIENFIATLEKYGLENLSYIAPFICVGEIILGLLFLFLIRINKIALVSIITLILFTLGFTYAHFFKDINDCGCFGEIGILKSSYSVSLFRNLIFILLSVIIYIYADKNTIPTRRWKIISIFCVTIISSVIAGFTINEPFITNEPFLNKHIQETPLSNYVTSAKDSTYLIFVFSYSCPHCWDATENIKAYTENKIINRVIGVALENSPKKDFYHNNFAPNFEILTTNSESIKLLVKSIPTAFFVKNDTIKVVIQGEITSPFTFKETYPHF